VFNTEYAMKFTLTALSYLLFKNMYFSQLCSKVDKIV